MSKNSKAKRDRKSESRIKAAKHMFKFGRELRMKKERAFWAENWKNYYENKHN